MLNVVDFTLSNSNVLIIFLFIFKQQISYRDDYISL